MPTDFQMPVPATGIFDTPTVSVCVNAQWASFIDGCLQPLLDPGNWIGDDDDQEAAVNQIEELLIRLSVIGGSCMPIGSIQMFGAASPPDGWLLCDGAAISRADYADLFAVVGTTWGVGNGTTTFNLPSFPGRSPMHPGVSQVPAIANTGGAMGVTLTVGQMPSHDHDYADPGHRHTIKVGTAAGTTALAVSSTNVATTAQTRDPLNDSFTGITFHAQGLNQSHNNLHPVLGVPFIIYAGI